MSALRQLVVQWLIAIVTTATASAYCSGGVLYRSDFERPSFTPGMLAGQNRWRNWFGMDAALITNVQPSSGLQSVQLVGAALEQRTGSLGTISEWFLNYDPIINDFPIVNIRAKMRSQATNSPEVLLGCLARIVAALEFATHPLKRVHHALPIRLTAESSTNEDAA